MEMATVEQKTGIETLAGIREKAMENRAKSRAQATQRAYKTDWADFTAWCSSNGLCALPATPETIELYITALAEVAKPATIARRIASISVAHGIAECTTNPTRSEIVRSALKAQRRIQGTAQASKDALVAADIKAIVSAVNEERGADSLYAIRTAALLLIGMAGAMRRSEIAALTLADVEFIGDRGVVIQIRRSKTDQEGKGREVAICYGAFHASCPVRALQRWINAAGITHGPLFREVDRHGRVGASSLNDRSIARLVKDSAALVGDAAKIGAHSLRAGFATQSVIAGKPTQLGMKQGGWKSVNTFNRYVRVGDRWNNNPTENFGL